MIANFGCQCGRYGLNKMYSHEALFVNSLLKHYTLNVSGSLWWQPTLEDMEAFCCLAFTLTSKFMCPVDQYSFTIVTTILSELST